MRKEENVLDMKITLRELRDLCIRYDRESGEYPESSYEGRAVFNDILYSMTSTDSTELKDHMFIDVSEVEEQ